MHLSSRKQGGQQQDSSTASSAFLGTEDQSDGDCHTKACTILHVLLAPHNHYLTLVSLITSPLSRLQTEVKQSLSFFTTLLICQVRVFSRLVFVEHSVKTLCENLGSEIPALPRFPNLIFI